MIGGNMSFWDKVKDFVGIEDEYYEDDMYNNDLEDENNYTDDDQEDYSDEYNDQTVYKTNREVEPVASSSRNTSRTQYSASKPLETKKTYGTRSDMQVTIKEPLTYEDGKAVLDDVIAGKTVVLNLEMLEMDKKTQIFYFVSGGLYSLRGSISNVTKDIYVLVPEGVEVDGKLSKTMSDKTLYQI